MIEKWNYFVYDLCEAKKKDVDEDSFHAVPGSCHCHLLHSVIAVFVSSSIQIYDFSFVFQQIGSNN